jgi:hypothetical protein
MIMSYGKPKSTAGQARWSKGQVRLSDKAGARGDQTEAARLEGDPERPERPGAWEVWVLVVCEVAILITWVMVSLVMYVQDRSSVISGTSALQTLTSGHL